VRIADEIQAKIKELEEKCMQSIQQAERKEEEYKKEINNGKRLMT
jgi:hypothetical protein